MDFSIDKRMIVLFAFAACFSCTPVKMAIPTEFAEQATQMKVKGQNKKKISFGTYKTSKVKNGWVGTSSRRKGGFVRLNVEDAFLETFGISSQHILTRSKRKFQFTIQEENLSARVFGLEASVTNSFEIVTRSSSWLNLLGHTTSFKYDFLATILPETDKYKDQWKLIFGTNYDRKKEDAPMFIDPVYLEEKGFATDQADTIFINSFYVKKAVSNKGKEGIMPKIKAGFELSWDGGLVCIVDTFQKSVWMFNDLEPSEKLILAAISSAILTRKVGH